MGTELTASAAIHDPTRKATRIARRILTTSLSVLVASGTMAAESSPSLPFPSPPLLKYLDPDEQQTHATQLLEHHRNRFRLATASAATSQDIGDVAVLVDNGAIILPARLENLLDLSLPTALVFVPTGTGFSVSLAESLFDLATGDALPLTDDDSIEVALGFSFQFFGATYSSVWVNSDGNLTFGEGDGETAERSASRLIGGPPRVAPLLNDLDPGSGGSVSTRLATDRIVVTWTDIPEFGVANANTFQVTLREDGTVVLAYARLDARSGVVGVAGGSLEGPFSEVDLTTDLPIILAAGAIFEEFVIERGESVDLIALANEFYRTHEDAFDFLVVFTEFPSQLGSVGGFAFHSRVKNETLGLGLPEIDRSLLMGSGGELESVLMMNRIGLYWPTAENLVDPPLQMFRFAGGASSVGPPGSERISVRARWMGTANDFWVKGAYSLGLNSAMSVLAQEVGHRWGAYVRFVHPTKGVGPDSFDLLGRSLEHWSFFFDVSVPDSQFGGDRRASSLEGNAITDFGGNIFADCLPEDTAFRTERNELIDGYTALDQYLMGLRVEDEVEPFWYVDEPTTIFTGASIEEYRGLWAFDDVDFCGKRVDLTVEDIQDFPGIGPRVPEIGDEVDHDRDGTPQLDRKTMAFILLVRNGPPGAGEHASATSQVDTFRSTWQWYANGPATGGRGRFDTSLRPLIH